VDVEGEREKGRRRKSIGFNSLHHKTSLLSLETIIIEFFGV
jgi:hypothetical protein